MSACWLNFNFYFFPFRVSFIFFFAFVHYALSVEINCKYYGYDWNNWGNRYTCAATLNNVLKANVTVTAVTGDHNPQRSFDDVEAVEIHGQTTRFLLKGLTNIFPEMDQLYIFRSDLKYLERSDFVSYTQLKTISLSRNHLSTNTIDFDTFEDLINLEYFSLSFNQLTAIPKLWTLVKLKELYLFENSIESLSVDDLANNKNSRFSGFITINCNSLSRSCSTRLPA